MPAIELKKDAPFLPCAGNKNATYFYPLLACALYKSLLSGLRQRMIYVVLGCLTLMPRKCPWLEICCDWPLWTIVSYQRCSTVGLRRQHEASAHVKEYIDLHVRSR